MRCGTLSPSASSLCRRRWVQETRATRRSLARRLVEAGHEAEVRDFLESAPFGIGKALSKGYEAELRHAPWAYELAFKMWFWFPFLLAPLAWVLTFFTRKKILLWVRDTHADIVVSTYPVATQVLGELRRRANRRWRNRNGLRVPVVNFITDFGFHPFWAHRGIDVNLAVPPSTVEAVGRRTGRPSVACGPLVAPSSWWRRHDDLSSGRGSACTRTRWPSSSHRARGASAL